jgi:hypothetical protein
VAKVAVMNSYALRFVLASIAVNALIGIIAIVSGDFSSLDGKILVTSLSVTGGAVLALANLAARTRGSLKYIPEVGAAASVIGFSIVIYAVWDEFDSETAGKSAFTFILIGSGIAHGALLSLSRLLPRYIPVLRAAWALAAVLVVMIITLIWAGEDVTDSDLFIRTMGVVVVLLAAVTLAVPILHRASRGALLIEARTEGITNREIVYCPNCGNSGLVDEGSDKRCTGCGVRFSVEYSA